MRMEELKMHPWFTRTLPMNFEAKLHQLKHTQTQLDQIFTSKSTVETSIKIHNLINEAASNEHITFYRGNKKSESTTTTHINTKKVILKTGIDTFTRDDYLNKAVETV